MPASQTKRATARQPATSTYGVRPWFAHVMAPRLRLARESRKTTRLKTPASAVATTRKGCPRAATVGPATAPIHQLPVKPCTGICDRQIIVNAVGPNERVSHARIKNPVRGRTVVVKSSVNLSHPDVLTRRARRGSGRWVTAVTIVRSICPTNSVSVAGGVADVPGASWIIKTAANEIGIKPIAAFR